MFIKGICFLRPFKGNPWPNRREPAGGARNSGVRLGTTDDAASYDHRWSKGNGAATDWLILSDPYFDGRPLLHSSRCALASLGEFRLRRNRRARSSIRRNRTTRVP